MKKKYMLSLCFIGFLLFISLGISVGYGLWVSNKREAKESKTLDCFKIYYSGGDGTIERHNVKPVVNEEGRDGSPITLTITNICKEPKELQLRLNITKDNTLNYDGLTLIAHGHIEQDTILYNDLISTKSSDKDVVQSKLIGLVKVEPNETVRTNIKYWFNERKTPNLDQTKVFKARFELIDTDSSIKPTISETILADNKVDKKKNVDLKKPAHDNQGLVYGHDDKGDIYVFRGATTNNYFEFAGEKWRIVRINSDKTVKIVLTHNIGNAKYSRFNNAIDYTGLKYIYNGKTINNDISNTLDEWYENNIASKGLDKYVANSLYCNDSSSSIEKYHTYFGGYKRVNNVAPDVICPQTNNDFGGLYTQKIGLLSVDEIMVAGGLKDVTNKEYFIYSGESFFTMTPAEYYNYRAYIYYVDSNGTFQTAETNTENGVRPVLNIDSTVNIKGKGTYDNPYVIDNS